MSKKPVRSRHRIPSEALQLRTESISDRYQVEVDTATDRLEARYRKLQRALEKAEARATKLAEESERLAALKAEADRIAAHRLDEESKLAQRIADIREAAKRSRVESYRQDMERQRLEVVRARNAITEQRKKAAAANRAREVQIRTRRTEMDSLTKAIEERRRELREIERLMMPGHCNNRDSRKRAARHETGAA
ncbi:hypothetical protein [Nocardia aurea]|uniref:hypothetical protein n=1 Tax=Nocardia aurea TaxID=2144174 RepID=UPI0033AB6662